MSSQINKTLIDVYLLWAAMAQAMIFFAQVSLGQPIFSSSILFVLNAAAFLSYYGRTSIYRYLPNFENSLFLLCFIQTVLSVTTAFEVREFTPLIMAFLPPVALVIMSFGGRLEFKRIKKRSMSLLFLGFTLSAVLQGFFESGFLTTSKMIFLAGSVFLMYGLSYFGRKVELHNRGLNHYHGRKSSLKKDRMFMHDITNQVHGMRLFLEARMSQQRGLDLDEVKALHRELRVSQSLILDHFEGEHKDFVKDEWVSFERAKISLYQLFDTYLTDHMKIDFNSEEVFDKVHLPTFYRVMNNLIKNVHESKSEWVKINIKALEGQIHIHIANSLGDSDYDSRVTNVIENLVEEVPREKLGLSSVTELVEALGGSAKFHISGDLWVSEIILPTQHMNSIKLAG